ncbi:MAG: tRNA epoxyqueuosine(34) reductase QueG, partial [Planctomycetota bacterium]|nr:tRNA epoxyqueuosine(34) reductase QueG [Planctomycetota bacterium]
AREEGFDLAGVAPLEPPPAAERFRGWLAAGRHAGMSWLARSSERICDPRQILPGARSLVVVGLAHARPEVELPGGGRVARYAAGRDYHNVIGRMLRRLAQRLVDLGLGRRWRKVVDAGPLLERSHAAAAGLGFESRAANLLHPRFGPWFFLGELIVEEELEPTPSPPPGSCGTCTACIEACPTGAILEPGVVDSNRCISYHTIENRGRIPDSLREALGEWAFGCDVCSEVCPWGRRAEDTTERFGTHARVAEGSLVDWLLEPPEAFAASFQGSALRRARREGLARNAALVLGNRPSEAGGEALRKALAQDPSSLVREAAAWGLTRGHGTDAGTREALERAMAAEIDPEAGSGMRRSRERLGP